MRTLSQFSILLLLLFFSTIFTRTEAYDPDRFARIIIKWDIINWTSDGYVAVVKIYNFQQHRPIQAPGWTLEWTWSAEEVILNMVGAQTTEQGDCSKFKGNTPHCCKKTPTVVDLLPGTPYNQQIANCCRGGVMSAWGQDSSKAVSVFLLTVGAAGTTKKTVLSPKSLGFKAPGPGYVCHPAMAIRPSKVFTADKRNVTQAMKTWKVICGYSWYLAQKPPTCCVSLSSFYNNLIVPCPKCACGSQSNSTLSGGCVNPDAQHLASVVSSSGENSPAPLVQSTPHMCPIRVHWHVESNDRDYWRVKITITNLNYNMNYSQWNLVVQHPNFGNLTQISSFNYKLLTFSKKKIYKPKDRAMFWGVQFYNDLLMQAGSSGNVESELLFRKDKTTFTLKKDWTFPRSLHFNGDLCVMPPPDAYPWSRNARSNQFTKLDIVMIFALSLGVVSLFQCLIIHCDVGSNAWRKQP